MELTNTLINTLKQKAISEISQQVAGGDSDVTQKIIAQALPKILSGLETNSQSQEGAESLSAALEKHDGSVLQNLGKIDLSDGSKILGHIFSDENSVAENIAKTSGSDTDTTKKVMAALAPLVMGALGEQKSLGKLDANDLTKILSGVSKDSGILTMFLDQDGDGDVDSGDAIKFWMKWFQSKILGKK